MKYLIIFGIPLAFFVGLFLGDRNGYENGYNRAETDIAVAQAKIRAENAANWEDNILQQLDSLEEAIQ